MSVGCLGIVQPVNVMPRVTLKNFRCREETSGPTPVCMHRRGVVPGRILASLCYAIRGATRDWPYPNRRGGSREGRCILAPSCETSESEPPPPSGHVNLLLWMHRCTNARCEGCYSPMALRCKKYGNPAKIVFVLVRNSGFALGDSRQSTPGYRARYGVWHIMGPTVGNRSNASRQTPITCYV